MKKLKYMFWLTLIGLLAVLIYQNNVFFSTKHSLSIDLVFGQYKTPELATGAIIAIFVGFAILLMMMIYFASRFENYRAKKTIKQLTAGKEEDAKTIAALNEEVELLKGGGEAPMEPESANDETEASDETDPAIETEASPPTQA